MSEQDGTDRESAIRILQALARGRHPLTGERLPQESCYQSADILRALLSALQALERAPRKKKLPPNAGQPWTKEADDWLAAQFDRGVTIRELARQLQRTPGSIGSRLEKLGKIQKYIPREPVMESPIRDEGSGEDSARRFFNAD